MKFRRCTALDQQEQASAAAETGGGANGAVATQTAVPASAVAAALGCADPNALVQVNPEDTVLDVGAGSCGDINVLISEASRVGPHGLVYALATENGERARVEAEAPNVRFVDGSVGSVRLPDRSVDVVVSNCLVCLSADKQQTIDDAFRLLRHGGRLGLADVVTLGDIPDSVRAAAGPLGAALDIDDYTARLRAAGFDEADVEIVRPFTRDDIALLAPMLGSGLEHCSDEDLAAADGSIAGAFVRASRR
jgi:SAM-dependent methyltransferase